MAGFRANTNRCGAYPSLAGGQAHPRGSLVSAASVDSARCVAKTPVAMVSEKATTTCPAGPSFSPSSWGGRIRRGPNRVKIDFPNYQNRVQSLQPKRLTVKDDRDR
jgi:hypothetical protein